jgi:hypothetical protein
VLENLGQLCRHDLSGPYGLVPNADGTFNNRRLDLFLAEADPAVRAWLITAAGALSGFVMTAPADGGGGPSATSSSSAPSAAPESGAKPPARSSR